MSWDWVSMGGLFVVIWGEGMGCDGAYCFDVFALGRFGGHFCVLG